MNDLFEKSTKLISRINTDVERQLMRPIDWNWQLNGIVGARGTGKTTLLLQQLKKLGNKGKKVLYASLDDFYFTENRLYDLALTYYQRGGQYLFLDEIHKYESWSRELKNIYDSIPELKITFSGSSITEITRKDIDLSRRALFYELTGLSFREFLVLEAGINLQTLSLEDVLNRHMTIASDISSGFRPLEMFNHYLKRGYYPFFLEENRDYRLTLEQVIQLILEVDMKYMDGFDPGKSRKLMQLIRVIASTAPFKPNIHKLSERIGINRNTLIHYLHYLEKARLIRLLNVVEKDISVLQKPDKLLLDNPNLYDVLAAESVSSGSLRETFFVSQVAPKHELHLHRKADFIIDHIHVIEVGGRGKGSRQINGVDDAYLAVDDLEIGFQNRIPLWLFGLLY